MPRRIGEAVCSQPRNDEAEDQGPLSDGAPKRSVSCGGLRGRVSVQLRGWELSSYLTGRYRCGVRAFGPLRLSEELGSRAIGDCANPDHGQPANPTPARLLAPQVC